MKNVGSLLTFQKRVHDAQQNTQQFLPHFGTKAASQVATNIQKDVKNSATQITTTTNKIIVASHFVCYLLFVVAAVVSGFVACQWWNLCKSTAFASFWSKERGANNKEKWRKIFCRLKKKYQQQKNANKSVRTYQRRKLPWKFFVHRLQLEEGEPICHQISTIIAAVSFSYLLKHPSSVQLRCRLDHTAVFHAKVECLDSINCIGTQTHARVLVVAT